MSDDRPKRSWKEIDATRDRSSGQSPRRDPNAFDRERSSKTAAYGKYKSQLDKLFTPGGAELPEAMKAKLGPASESSKQKAALQDALQKDPGATTLKAYLDAEFELPDDARLLMRMLDIDDTALLVPLLEKLIDIVEGGKRPNRMLLIQRIDALVMRHGDGPAVELAQTLRSALG